MAPVFLTRILVCIDFSELTNPVIEYAKALAKLAGSELRLLHVAAPNPDFVGFEAGPDTVRQQVASTLRGEHAKLERLAAQLREEGVDASPLMVQGPTAVTILDQARRFRAHLVVIGSEGHGALFQLFGGSVAQGVLRESGIPVLVVPAKRRSPSSGRWPAVRS